MEFPDRDGLHVTHCDTFGPVRSSSRILAVDELSLDCWISSQRDLAVDLQDPCQLTTYYMRTHNVANECYFVHR